MSCRFIAILALCASTAAGAERFDLLLSGGRVVDGTGAPWYAADVGIAGGKIVSVGRLDRAAAAANEIMAYDRGRIAPGLAADLVVFDDQRVQDKASFAEPNAVSEGIKYVLVGGVVVLESGHYTGAKPGKVLRRPGSLP